MASAVPFVPVQPPRPREWAPVWRGFFGERFNISVYRWPAPVGSVARRPRGGMPLIAEPPRA